MGGKGEAVKWEAVEWEGCSIGELACRPSRGGIDKCFTPYPFHVITSILKILFLLYIIDY